MAGMTERRNDPEISRGAAEHGGGAAQASDRSGGRPVQRGKNAAIETWLQLHLRQLYEEVCSEPVPNELNEMIDRFRRRRQDTEAGGDKVLPLTPPARQGS